MAIRALARAAGVHVYSDSDDAFYLGDRFFGLHARAGSPRTIRFPRPVTVTDMWTGRRVASRRREVVLSLRRHATGLYYYR